MKALVLIAAGSLALAPLAFGQSHAVPRGGGGGGSSGGGGGSHPSGGSGSSSSSSSGGSGYSGGSSSSSGSSSSYSGSGESRSGSRAERRHPKAGTGTGQGGYSRGGRHDGRGYGSHSYRYYSYPGWGWSGGYWWPYGSYGWYGGYWGGPYWGGGTVYHRVERESGSVRVLVDPPDARVYVDGYYAGIVDDYDGLFQRLRIPPGRHEITVKLEGYRTHRMKVFVPTQGTVKLHHDMERGSGESQEELAGNAEAEERELELRRQRARERAAEREAEREADAQSEDEAEEPLAEGRLRLKVEPLDASVYVDGAFRGTGREARSLRLPAGRHRIEVVRPGYETESQEIEIDPDETTELRIELDRGAI